MSGLLRNLLLLVCVATPATVVAQADSAPHAVVERLHATLLSVMTGAGKLGYRGRFELIGPVLDESFDFPAIARIVSGRHWKELDEAGRAAFTRTFADLSTATYASNFADFGGERFATLGTEEARGGIIVRTELAKADGEKVSLNYMLHQSNGAWRIVNVIAQGVSDLSLKRAEYTAVIKTEGFDSLVKRLQQKISEMGRAS